MAMQGSTLSVNAVGNSNDVRLYAPLVRRHHPCGPDAGVRPTQEGYGFSAVRRPLIFQYDESDLVERPWIPLSVLGFG